MDTFSVMWGTEQTNILLVPSFPSWETERGRVRGRERGIERGERERERQTDRQTETERGGRERERERGGGVTGGGGGGGGGRREKRTEGEGQWEGEDRDWETDRQTNKDQKHEFHPSEEVIMMITKSSYYHHTNIHTSILHIADYHWSIDDRLTIKQLSKNVDLVSIIRSSIDKWSIDSRSSSIDCSFILWLYRSSMGGSLLVYIVRTLAIDHDWW